ncbi:MAG: hypothetical protein DMD82_16765 [Candidatus Rokuibacteriota bacterium]|nr:MAG: hypothetical protein DMD82_16765 [Candidatus Rokubacteria bacterium]
MPQHPVEIILMRQLASYLATPIFLVDPAGNMLLIHDAQYTAAEYPPRVGWGHSTIDHTLRFAAEAGARRVVTFHHDPAHSDATLDRLVEEAHRSGDLPFELIPRKEGAGFEL